VKREDIQAGEMVVEVLGDSFFYVLEAMRRKNLAVFLNGEKREHHFFSLF